MSKYKTIMKKLIIVGVATIISLYIIAPLVPPQTLILEEIEDFLLASAITLIMSSLYDRFETEKLKDRVAWNTVRIQDIEAKLARISKVTHKIRSEQERQQLLLDAAARESGKRADSE